jgi:hypothetical protein
MNLLLKKFNDRVALGDRRITFIDLVFPVMNGLNRIEAGLPRTKASLQS